MPNRPELIDDIELEGIRADLEVAFEETCSFYREQPSIPSDVDIDGTLITARDTIYSDVPAALYPILSRRDRFDEFGGSTIFTRQYRVQVAWHFVDVQIRDIVIFTDTADPRALGREFLVRDVVEQTNIGMRLITVQDSSE